jgi:hypothetical protein
MTRNIVFFVLLALGLLACQEPVEQPVLSDEKLARIMADLYIAETVGNGLNGPAKDSVSRIYIQQVFEMHGTDTAVYQKELLLRSAPLDRLEKIHEEAMRLLGEKKEKTLDGRPVE